MNDPTPRPWNETLDDAQRALSELCKDPRAFTMRVPADEKRDIDLRIGKALRLCRELLNLHDELMEALENAHWWTSQIQAQPAKEWQNFNAKLEALLARARRSEST